MNNHKTYYIIIIGCQMNKSDAERIAGYLESIGYEETADRKSADVVILTTCGVRQSAESRVYGLVPRIKKENPKTTIILTGCLSERTDVRKRLNKWVDIWLPTKEIPNLNLEACLPDSQVSNSELSNCDYLKIKPKHSTSFSAFVPIGNGCNNFCSYCVVPYARGRESYRPSGDIIKEVQELVKKGYKEITLIAQNVNSYEYNTNDANDKRMTRIADDVVNFPKLLRMVNDIPGDFWIRFATSHPKDMSKELIKTIAECDKVCKHVHLPAQAGDNEILRRMNRKYTIEHYLGLLSEIRKQCDKRITSKQWFPPVAISVDIIVGYPGETKKQFGNTVKLFKVANYDMAYLAQYSPRPGTASAKEEDDVPVEEKKRREKELNDILSKTCLKNNKRYLGKTVKILCEAVNKNGELMGRTETNKVVRVHCGISKKEKSELVGKFLDVKIVVAEDFGLNGELGN
jgi:tRNA-2-methylthio-N6-dimethylallyladenosine synthase